MTLQQSDAFSIFKPLMERFGATCSPDQFYWNINDAYHTVEAADYDRLHESMFTMPDQIWLRALAQLPEYKQKLCVLDVGSGTGLVGELLNRLAPSRVESLTCIEPNVAMIRQAKLKANRWNFNVTFVNGDLAELPERSRFDVIIINSVLHHVVNLEELFRQVSQLLNVGGILITELDPRRAASTDPVSSQRQLLFRNLRWFDPFWVAKAIRLRVNMQFAKSKKTKSLAEKVNTILLEKGVVSMPLDMASIYAVTDVHVPGQPGNIGHGIEVEEMKGWLKDCNLLDYYTYQFFGVDWTYLGYFQQIIERRIYANNDGHGFLFGSVWKHQ